MVKEGARMKQRICRSCLAALGVVEPADGAVAVHVPATMPPGAEPEFLRQELVGKGPCDWCALFSEHPPVKFPDIEGVDR